MIAVIFEVEFGEEGTAEYLEHAAHRATQAAGRAGIFDDYRIRVANVLRDYGLYERDEAPPFHRAVERRVRSSPATTTADPPAIAPTNAPG